MDQADAEEFLQVYKGVVHEYPLMVAELSCGPCIAMEVCGNDAQAAMREMAGPPDPVCIDTSVLIGKITHDSRRHRHSFTAAKCKER